MLAVHADVPKGGTPTRGVVAHLSSIIGATFEDAPATLANAHLIAASPALYEALEGVITLVDLAVSCWEDCPYPDVMKTRLARAKLALALARGEQPESRA